MLNFIFIEYFIVAFSEQHCPTIIPFDLVYDWKSFLTVGITNTLSNHLAPHYFKFVQDEDTSQVVMYFKDSPTTGIFATYFNFFN